MYDRRYRSSVNLGSNALLYKSCPSQLTFSLLRSIFLEIERVCGDRAAESLVAYEKTFGKLALEEMIFDFGT